MTHNGPPLQGGVLLGGRELRLRISQDAHTLLSAISQAGGRSQHDLATDILHQGIRQAWVQLCQEKVIYVLTHWWGDWRIAHVE